MQPSRKVILGLCTFVTLFTSVGLSSFTLFLPAIETEFGLTRTLATVPYTVAMIGWGIGAVWFGKLADDGGPRRVVLAGIILMAAGFFGMGLSQNLWHLSLSFGLLVGLAMGACGTTIMSLVVSNHFDAQGRGLAVSAVQVATPLNPLIFAPLLFMLITKTDWRTAALVTAGVLAFVALPAAWVGAWDRNAPESTQPTHVDWGACLSYLRHRPLVILFLGRFACGLAFFQIAHLVTFTMSKGFSAATGTTALSVFGASAAVWGLLFGWLADRYGRAHMLAISYIVRGVGTAVLALAVPTEFWFYVLVALGIGPTFGTVGVTNVMFYEVVGPQLAGVMLGLSFIVHQIGSAGGPMLGSILFDLTGSYSGFTLIMAVILLVAGALTFSITDATARLPGAAPVPNSIPKPGLSKLG